MKSSTERGYGAKHQALRKRLLPQAVGRPCARCGQPMQAGQPIELDHTDDRRGYKGFSHAECNRRAGGWKRAAQVTAALSNPRPRPATRW